MSRKTVAAALCTVTALLALGSTGCIRTTMGPMLPIPIPVSPYFQDNKEDEAWEHERYERVPILGPITAGGPAVALDPPERRRSHGRVREGPADRGRLPAPA